MDYATYFAFKGHRSKFRELFGLYKDLQLSCIQRNFLPGKFLQTENCKDWLAWAQPKPGTSIDERDSSAYPFLPVRAR